MSSTTTMILPGMIAEHAIISDTCRENRGDMGAFDEAVRRLREEYARCIEGWRGTPGVTFHLALTVERPEKSP